ncbi:hypothetical protein AVEN_36466-1 [Araneus ventricosus]|uniref:Uncharacterized protein n=1 Tax=Araneus ventricosus TaxID=182803 RepID=A0A4Y2MKK4_ARAVE|nr:hypothetical protein AVEN_36466-1 [Araneus ventricosus]
MKEKNARNLSGNRPKIGAWCKRSRFACAFELAQLPMSVKRSGYLDSRSAFCGVNVKLQPLSYTTRNVDRFQSVDTNRCVCYCGCGEIGNPYTTQRDAYLLYHITTMKQTHNS